MPRRNVFVHAQVDEMVERACARHDETRSAFYTRAAVSRLLDLGVHDAARVLRDWEPEHDILDTHLAGRNRPRAPDPEPDPEVCRSCSDYDRHEVCLRRVGERAQDPPPDVASWCACPECWG